MKRLAAILCLVLLAIPADAPAQAPSAEAALIEYLGKWLFWDPDGKITVVRAPAQNFAGFTAWKVNRTGRYARPEVKDMTVWVSNDGKWFFGQDVLPNPPGRPVSSRDDLAWLDARLSQVYRTPVRVALDPSRDAGGLKAIAIPVNTGFSSVRLPGYVTADGRNFLQGSLWDFTMDPRAERRKKIELAPDNRAQGPADATVQIAEYADMECGYCKYRGKQLDRILQANPGIKIRRRYKFYPLWFHHAWAMKAASAADCLATLGKNMFKFKDQVYARQESLTVAGIDELALQAAEAEGIPSADFLKCYLQDPSFARLARDMEEGQRLGVNSTPTYYVDGTEIIWIEDRVMEDFLKTKFPSLKGISYEK
ncbi:MAG TPA: thioredoxin domain-containing protein [Thermoanaerobaculia bacterium]